MQSRGAISGVQSRGAISGGGGAGRSTYCKATAGSLTFFSRVVALPVGVSDHWSVVYCQLGGACAAISAPYFWMGGPQPVDMPLQSETKIVDTLV